MYTATYALILVFAMLIVVTVGIAVNFHRVRMQFKQDKKGFKNTTMSQFDNNNNNTNAAESSTRERPKEQ